MEMLIALATVDPNPVCTELPNLIRKAIPLLHEIAHSNLSVYTTCTILWFQANPEGRSGHII